VKTARWRLAVFFAGAFSWATVGGQTTTNSVLSPDAHAETGKMAAATDDGKPAPHDLIAPLEQQWKAERDPAKRADLAHQLVEAIIHDYDEQPVAIADEVARDGLPENRLAAPAPRSVALEPVHLLAGAHSDVLQDMNPVMRRLAANRIEAWMPKEGWLFDSHGRLLADVHVPRRDGSGRQWFGAFLPDARWITTDLWNDDRQLTCFDPHGDPRWELPGSRIVAAVQAVNPTGVLVPSIGWARADRTGRAWLVSVGQNSTRGFARITPGKEITALPNNVKLWQQVYFRSMDVRGMYTELFIDSDDAKVSLARSAAGHGAEVGWPTYSLAGSSLSTPLNVTVNEGNDHFGFWPHEHDLYLEAGNPWQGSPPTRVWFFTADGRYCGDIAATFLGDAANGRDLLVQTDAGDVATVHRSTDGTVSATEARRFTWPDGMPAFALAVYDDLKLGFFLRGPGILGKTDSAEKARANADMVLARW
jgi:hypothetical protein